MPISLFECSEGSLCYGFRWEIANEQQLAKIVARLMLGHYRHVQKVLAGDNQSVSPQISDEMIDELVRRLSEPENDTQRYHRDGWVFQMIAWIAAKLAEPTVLTAIPHSQPAQKGFDNLIIELTGDNEKIRSLVICEDKATERCRKTIRQQVWPEIEDFETGRRDHELVNEVTAILERCRSIVDIDECVASIFWKKARRYRVSITTHRSDDKNGRRVLFKGYKRMAPGKRSRRRAETLKIANLRQWMDRFCGKIINYLEGLDV